MMIVVGFSVAMVNPWLQATWRGKGLLDLTGYKSHSNEAKSRIQAGMWMQEIKPLFLVVFMEEHYLLATKLPFL